VRVLLANPRWESRLRSFLKLSRVGRFVEAGTDEDIQDGWLGGVGGGGGEEACSVTLSPFASFLLCPHHLLGGPIPENGAQRRLEAEDFLCMG
jgi:hypothetical protein